jgi:Tfp pilus assembly protein PilX
MAQSVNAWLQAKIDEYKFNVRDATVDFYLADAALSRPEADINQLKGYNSLCLDMANLCPAKWR